VCQAGSLNGLTWMVSQLGSLTRQANDLTVSAKSISHVEETRFPEAVGLADVAHPRRAEHERAALRAADFIGQAVAWKVSRHGATPITGPVAHHFHGLN